MSTHESATTMIKQTLPSGWQSTKLGSIATIISGQSPPGDTYRKLPEGLPFFQGKADFGHRYPVARTWCIAPVKTAKPGDILISVRAPVGPTNVADVECCIGRGLAAIRPHDNVDPNYILYALHLYEPSLANKGKGSTFDAINRDVLENLSLPMPPLAEQRRIVAILDEQMAAVERARAAVEAQGNLLADFIEAHLRASLLNATPVKLPLSSALTEVSRGVGASWGEYDLLGATRAGIAPAKEGVGKTPERYKRVEAATVFYNPMRILLGSIGMVDEGEQGGITSPDYVVFKTTPGKIHHRWFYYWLRSSYGEHFIKTLARGAVRERILFRRLASATIDVPPWDEQVRCSESLRAVYPLKKAITEQRREIDALPSALLRHEFSGESLARKPAHNLPRPLPQGIVFTRGAIAAYILDKTYRQPTMGRVKFEKMLYLSETHVGIDLYGNYERKAAGPLDANYLVNLESLARKRHWFYRHDRGGEGYFYRPGDAIADRVRAAVHVLGERRGRMDAMLNLFAPLDTERTEIVATLFAAWNDFLIDGYVPSDTAIISEVLERWHEAKQRIPEERWRDALRWMRSEGFVPTGMGPRTETGNG